jgi:hypothetical protein
MRDRYTLTVELRFVLVGEPVVRREFLDGIPDPAY